MKRIALLLALVLVLGCVSCLTGCLRAVRPGTRETAPSGTAPTVETAPVPAESAAEKLPDFTVATVDGGSFTLSEALRDHELVLINLWATWCGPCAREFPYLQEAWSQRRDRVAVIALSIEPDDTAEVLRAYAAEKGMTFPVGREEGTGLNRFVTEGIPTTILVDRTGKIAAVEVGALSSTQQFLDLFDRFTGEDYDPNLCTHTVVAYDQNYAAVAGVVVNFCTDTACTPVTTDESGTAVFTGPAARYHVEVIGVPEGMKVLSSREFETETYGQTFYLPLGEAAK